MLHDASPTFNPAVSLENDPLFQPQNQQELSLTSSTNSRSIEQAAARIASTARTAGTALPDLAITSTLPKSFYAGDTVSFTYTEKNAGKAQAGGSWTYMYLSSDAKLDSSDLLLGKDPVNAIAAGKSSIESASFTTKSTTAPGTYYVLFQADARGQVGESNENNNVFASRVTIQSKQPDLTLPIVNAPSSADAGSKITISYTEKNIGLATAGRHETQMYLSKDRNLDSNDRFLGNNVENPLGAGASRNGSKTVSLASDLASGNYYVIFSADGKKQVVESNENNNLAYAPISIKGQSKPDLLLPSFSGPSIAAAGETIGLNYNLKNQGNLAAGASQTSFYLSKDAVWDSGDALLGSNLEAGLKANGSINGSKSVTIDTKTVSGDYYLLGVADAKGQVAELDEKNNSFAQKITITGSPDLTFNPVSAPKSSQAGETITLKYTLNNLGAGAAGLNTTGFYLSKDNLLDSSDLQLSNNAEDVLAGGKSRNGTASVELPLDLQTGNYYILFSADDHNTVVESNESNNVVASQIAITGLPDLTIDLTAPTSARPGETITLKYTEKNIGGGDAGFHYDTFYLSQDDVFDSSDTYLTDSYVSSLAAGASFDGSVSVNLGSLPEGTYYLIGITDSDNYVKESSETNNTDYLQIEIKDDGSGYSSIYGYGRINAASAVAKAIGQEPFADVPDLGGNDWGADLVKAPEVWAKGYTGQGVVVAVLDTGVDHNHSDLSNNIWTNSGEIADNGIDDDGNGYTDDVYGWDFAYGNNDTLDNYGHGTHVSGTIAGVKNDFGVTGIAYDAKIMPVKVLDDSGSGFWSDVASGIYYAVNNGANVINMSLGGSFDSPEVRAAVEYASSQGAIVVSAAGNSSEPEPIFPGHYATNWGLVAGAIDINGDMPYFSNRAGSNPDMAYLTAPGVNVYSTVPGNGYDYYSGTSMATPHIAGVVALMLSANHSLTDAQVRQYVTETASHTGSLSTTKAKPTFNLSNSTLPGIAMFS